MKNSEKVKYSTFGTKGTDRMYRLLYWPITLVFGIFHPVRVIGWENIPEGTAVITANHSALADPLMVVAACGSRYPLRIMAKEELFHIPVVGWLLIKAGIFGVNRGQNDMAAVKRAIKVLKEGCKLMMFPEGTRVKEGEEQQDAKTGAIVFAARAGAPLVPVYVPRKKKWFRRTTITIGEAYLPDVPARRASQEDYQRAADELMRRIYALGDEQG